MCSSGHAGCGVLERHARSPRGALVDRRGESDSPGFVVRRHGSDITVCSWEHGHGAPEHCVLKSRTVKGDGSHRRLLFLSSDCSSQSTISCFFVPLSIPSILPALSVFPNVTERRSIETRPF